MPTDTVSWENLGEFEVLAGFPPFNENSLHGGITLGFKSTQVC
jgi:hypothetical protein